MDETRNSAQDSTQLEFALGKYLELFNSNCDFFKFFIAQNGVLEWFGRTIKGNQKIHDFLRYEVCSQYDHLLFETAQPSEPFECKSTHMETKKLPGDKDVTESTNLNNSSFAGDKTDLNAQTSTSFEIEPSQIDRRDSITPPSTAKRFKHDNEHDLNRSSLPLLNIEDYFGRKDCSMKGVPLEDKSCFETPIATIVEPGTSTNTGYSELRYFQTTGILRSCTQPEPRSFRNASSLNVNGTWDRETRILVSYRIRLHDNDIQFALIIYQNMHPYSSISRRNLMSEFEEVASTKKSATNENSAARSVPTKEQIKRKIGRRLRLF